MSHPVNDDLVDRIIDRYVCERCGGDVLFRTLDVYDDDPEAYCPECDGE